MQERSGDGRTDEQRRADAARTSDGRTEEQRRADAQAQTIPPQADRSPAMKKNESGATAGDRAIAADVERRRGVDGIQRGTGVVPATEKEGGLPANWPIGRRNRTAEEPEPGKGPGEPNTGSGINQDPKLRFKGEPGAPKNAPEPTAGHPAMTSAPIDAHPAGKQVMNGNVGTLGGGSAHPDRFGEGYRHVTGGEPKGGHIAAETHVGEKDGAAAEQNAE